METGKTKVYNMDKGKYDIYCDTGTYRVDRSLLFASISAAGEELLSAPIRICGKDNGKKLSFAAAEVFSVKDDGQDALCSAAEGGNYIVNAAIKAEDDGWTDIEIKLMPQGKKVEEVFCVSRFENPKLELSAFYLEIPLKKTQATHYHYWPQESGFDQPACGSGSLNKDMNFSFKPLFWLGNTKRGICFYSDSDKNWTPNNNQALEIKVKDDEVILRINFLSAKPASWRKKVAAADEEEFLPAYAYMPVVFRFGLQITPVKAFPRNAYLSRSLHIDCYKKISGSYKNFLFSVPKDAADKNYFDRIQRLGVNTLYLHEKWHRIQNSGYVAEDTAKDIEAIVLECKKRSIRVIPYFGYEISTLSPGWSKTANSLNKTNGLYPNGGGWYRMPPQRDYSVCLNGDYAEQMIKNIDGTIRRFGFDGVYLDSTLFPAPCCNVGHGCGYMDENNEIHETYTVFAVRKFMKKLRETLPASCKINAHVSNCCNVPALSFCDGVWVGEFIQTQLNREGAKNISFGLMQAEYTGRNMGIPYEFISYGMPNWRFENALSLALPHGILPRPNDADEALAIIAPYWSAMDRFPIENAEWKPYWSNNLPCVSKEDSVKCSYYEYRSVDGKIERLFLIGNICGRETTAKISEKANYVKTLAGGEAVLSQEGICVHLKPYGAAAVYAVFNENDN